MSPAVPVDRMDPVALAVADSYSAEAKADRNHSAREAADKVLVVVEEAADDSEPVAAEGFCANR